MQIPQVNISSIVLPSQEYVNNLLQAFTEAQKAMDIQKQLMESSAKMIEKQLEVEALKARNLELQKSRQNTYTYNKTNTNEQSKSNISSNGAIDETLNSFNPPNEQHLNSSLDKDWQRSAALIKRDYKLTSKTKLNLWLDNLTSE